MKKIIRTDNAPKAIGPYSQAVEAGPFVFLSGQIPLDHRSGTIVPGDTRTQARQVLKNAEAILAAAGCSLDMVVRTTIFLADLNDFAAVNEEYAVFFPNDPPARSTVEVSRLPREASVEMDFIAVRS